MIPRLIVVFENLLWYSRLIVIVPVVGSIAMGFAAVYLATVQTLSVFTHLGGVVEVASSTRNLDEVTNELLAAVIKAADIYLLAAILLIFGLGLYELFIDR
ncbi:MAG TPA: YqhA family protein, partial [Chloroflexota bacterium]|nr:YqhA family protein [Chloroflexota bacterium]